MHPRFNPQCPQLLEMRPGLIQHIRVVMGNQRKPLKTVRIRRQGGRENDHGIPVFGNRRAEQDADRIGAGGSGIGNNAVGDERVGAEVPEQVVQLFSREERNRADFDAMNADHRDAWNKSIRYDSLLFATIEVATGITMAVILGMGTGLAEVGIMCAATARSRRRTIAGIFLSRYPTDWMRTDTNRALNGAGAR